MISSLNNSPIISNVYTTDSKVLTKNEKLNVTNKIRTFIESTIPLSKENQGQKREKLIKALKIGGTITFVATSIAAFLKSKYIAEPNTNPLMNPREKENTMISERNVCLYNEKELWQGTDSNLTNIDKILSSQRAHEPTEPEYHSKLRIPEQPEGLEAAIIHENQGLVSELINGVVGMASTALKYPFPFFFTLFAGHAVATRILFPPKTRFFVTPLNKTKPATDFTTLSFNLGVSLEDTELLLASFYKPIQELIDLSWHPDVPNFSKRQDESADKKADLVLNTLIPEYLANKNSLINEKYTPLSKAGEKRILEKLLNDNEVKFIIMKFLDELKVDSIAKDYKTAIEHKYGRRGLAKNFLEKLRETSETEAVNQIMAMHPDVLFLQEVGDEKRKFMLEVMKEYSTNHVNIDVFDSAIALNPDRFININNYSDIIFSAIAEESNAKKIQNKSGKDPAICVATDKNTKKRFAFVSAHIPGFPYRATGEQLEREGVRGNQFCQKLLLKLKEIEQDEAKKGTPIDATIIGADVNASPEKFKKRFSLFTRQGFEVKGTGSPTNVHFIDPIDQAREIDYFLFRSHPSNVSPFNRIVHWLKSPKKIVMTASSFPYFGFDMAHNMSDHKPILGRVHVVEKSLLDRLKEGLGLVRTQAATPLLSNRTINETQSNPNKPIQQIEEDSSSDSNGLEQTLYQPDSEGLLTTNPENPLFSSSAPSLENPNPIEKSPLESLKDNIGAKATPESNPENRITLNAAINQNQNPVNSIGQNAEIVPPNQIQPI